MNISARNVFRGRVGGCRDAGFNVEIEVALGGGGRLVAVVERDCAQTLGLDHGKEVVALVKAPWVAVAVAAADAAGLSARNLLAGTVRSVARGTVNAEVVIALPGGEEVTATVTREAAADLGLAPGVAACAVIDASDVVLGLPG